MRPADRAKDARILLVLQLALISPAAIRQVVRANNELYSKQAEHRGAEVPWSFRRRRSWVGVECREAALQENRKESLTC